MHKATIAATHAVDLCRPYPVSPTVVIDGMLFVLQAARHLFLVCSRTIAAVAIRSWWHEKFGTRSKLIDAGEHKFGTFQTQRVDLVTLSGES